MTCSNRSHTHVDPSHSSPLPSPRCSLPLPPQGPLARAARGELLLPTPTRSPCAPTAAAWAGLGKGPFAGSHILAPRQPRRRRSRAGTDGARKGATRQILPADTRTQRSRMDRWRRREGRKEGASGSGRGSPDRGRGSRGKAAEREGRGHPRLLSFSSRPPAIRRSLPDLGSHLILPLAAEAQACRPLLETLPVVGPRLVWLEFHHRGRNAAAAAAYSSPRHARPCGREANDEGGPGGSASLFGPSRGARWGERSLFPRQEGAILRGTERRARPWQWSWRHRGHSGTHAAPWSPAVCCLPWPPRFLLKHCGCDPARALPSGRSSSRFTQSLSFIRSPESAASAALYPLFNCNAHSSTRPQPPGLSDSMRRRRARLRGATRGRKGAGSRLT